MTEPPEGLTTAEIFADFMQEVLDDLGNPDWLGLLDGEDHNDNQNDSEENQ